MKRRPTTQDVSWFLDLQDNERVNLNPPYQRRSVWTRKDRVFFLDTIFQGYPCPAIFLHKDTNENGIAKYHVVDGKQRLETIFTYANNKMTMPKDFHDPNLAGKKFKDIDLTYKQKFWDYVLAVDMLDTVEQAVVDEVFDRLNRNSRKLERQELRHAKYDGWFINFAETQTEQQEWKDLNIVTSSRAKRMKDVQFISELLILSLTSETKGFSQDEIDEFYADYETPSEDQPDFDIEQFEEDFVNTRDFILKMEKVNECVSNFAKNFMHFYTLWNLVYLHRDQLNVNQAAIDYYNFMDKYTNFSKEDVAQAKDNIDLANGDQELVYAANSTGANTEFPQRVARYNALKSIVQ